MVWGVIADMGSSLAKEMWADERQEDSQQHALGMTRIDQEWREQMRASNFQAQVQDLKAAGLNPALAYPGSGAATPGGGAHVGGIAGGGGGTHSVAAGLATAAQIEMNEAAAEKLRAEAENIRGHTRDVQPATADKLRQEVKESEARIEKLLQDVDTGVATAAHLRQQTVNLREAIPQIRATVEQLQALAKLNAAQTYEALTRGQLHGEQISLTREQAAEIHQRIQANLPKVLANLQTVEAHLKNLQTPKAGMDAAVHSTRAGAALAGIRNFMASLFGR